MKSVILALSAATLYGLGSVLLEQKLSRFHGLTLITAYFPIMLMLAVISRQLVLAHSAEDPSLEFPRDWVTWRVLIVLAVVTFFANYFYCASYASGGNVIVITSLMVLVPIAAAGFRTIWVREMPNIYQILGFVFAVIAVMLIAKGSVKTG